MGIIVSFISSPPFPAIWWGLKVLPWLILLAVSFTIPNGFFTFLGNSISIIGETIFILIGLVLVGWICRRTVCGSNHSDRDSLRLLRRFWLHAKSIPHLIQSNTLRHHHSMCIHPVAQGANPRSGLLQSSMEAAYCAYLIIASAVGNHTHTMCNPLHDRTGSATHNTTVVVDAVFTFLAIAYSMTRAATQSKALIGKEHSGVIQLSGEDVIS